MCEERLETDSSLALKSLKGSGGGGGGGEECNDWRD